MTNQDQQEDDQWDVLHAGPMGCMTNGTKDQQDTIPLNLDPQRLLACQDVVLILQIIQM